jgi:peroxiredoxin
MLVYLTISVLVGALCWTWYHFSLQSARLALRLERVERVLEASGELAKSPEELGITGLKPGSVARDFELPVVDGGLMTLSEYSGRRVLIAFIHPNCVPSREFVSKLPPRKEDGATALLLASSGTLSESQEMRAAYDLSYPLLVDAGRDLWSMYQVHSTPCGYVIGNDSRTEGPLRIGGKSLLAAMGVPSGESTEPSPGTSPSIERSRLLRTGLKAGAVAPDFELPDLDGSTVALHDLRGNRVLLVFSDPHCAPCELLAPKLEKIHKGSRDLKVLMISRGEADANRAKRAEQQLTFPIVLQHQWEISRAYGMFATPIAYLIGKDGVLTQDVAVGHEAILRLAEL